MERQRLKDLGVDTRNTPFDSEILVGKPPRDDTSFEGGRV
jgi:hypothetical protein